MDTFIQADPLVQEPTESQSLNRYSYVMNNPLNATDPTGMFSVGGFAGFFGSMFGVPIPTKSVTYSC